MADGGQLSIAFLLARAEQCRLLARRAYSRSIAMELEKIAADYDQEAGHMERARPGSVIADTP